MTIETGAAAPAADDFASAFAEFSKPEDAAPAATDTTAAPAAPAAGEATPAATGGSNDTGGTGEPAAAAGLAPAGGDSGAAAPAGGETVAPANEGDKGGAAAPAAGSDTGAGGEATPPAAAPAAASPAAAAPADADTILSKLGELVEKASKPAEPAKPAEEAKPESPYTPEQTAELAQYEKDWPDVARMEGLRRQGEYKQLLDFVFAEVRKYVDPVMQTVDSLAGRTHLTDVKGAIPDYSDNLRQQVIDWSKTQPAYLQPAYEHVINSGTVDEVKDLVNRYRQATGQAAPAPGGAPAATSGQGKGGTNELSGAAKEAAAALAPVESKRSEVVGSGDPSSFDDGWAQFAKDLG